MRKPRVEDGLDEGGERAELTVEDILALGGGKEDLAMLADIDNGGDECDFGGGEGAAEELKLDDIQSFVKKLGLHGFSAKNKAKGSTTETQQPQQQHQQQPSKQSSKPEDLSKKERKKKDKKQKIESSDAYRDDEAKAIFPVGEKAESKKLKKSKEKNSEPAKKKHKLKVAESETNSVEISSPKDQSESMVPKQPKQPSGPDETSVSS